MRFKVLALDKIVRRLTHFYSQLHTTTTYLNATSNLPSAIDTHKLYLQMRYKAIVQR